MAENNGPKMLSIEDINRYTEEEVDSQLEEYETLLYRKLMPELNLQMAVYETQQMQQKRIRANIDIANKASEFVYRIKDGDFERALACFALNTEGVSAEITAHGIYEGKEKLREYFVDYYSSIMGKAGTLFYTNLCSPVIEVAEDGQTGRAMWLTVGMESWKRPDLTEGYTDPVSLWAINPWCMDFVMEDGVWKIWHLLIFEDIETVYEESWSESADHKIPVDPAIPEPTRPSERHNPFTEKRSPVLHAEPPVPYQTYDNDRF